MLLAVFIFLSHLQNSYAESGTGYGIGRTRSCDANGDPGGMDFDFLDGGDDSEFTLDNPICASIIVGAYAAVKLFIAGMNKTCGTGSVVPRVTPSLLMDSKDITVAGIKGASQSASGDFKCLAAVNGTLATWAELMGILQGVFEAANATYKNMQVCGDEWVSPNPLTYDISSPDYKKTVSDAVEGYIRDGQSEKLTLDSSGDKAYREFYYGGVEVEDNPATGSACRDVTQAKVNGEYPKQKYYLKGLGAGNYNCKKYDVVAANGKDPIDGSPLTSNRVAELNEAYDCCKERSGGYICLHDKSTGDNTFCKGGEYCTISSKLGDTNTDTYIIFLTKVLDNGSMICAQTYGFCPYNFTISGGSEYCDYYQDGIWNSSTRRWDMITPEDVAAGNCISKSEIRNSDCTYNNKANKCKNYCQFLRHCTTTSTSNYQYKNSLGSPYFSSACIDFVGDSKNQTSYGGGFIINSQKHFSAPIAQCVKETLENVFYNVAGHSECSTINEMPYSDGTCPSGGYAVTGNFTYKKGNEVKETSFFTIVQNTLQSAVKMALTLSIVFYGMNILMGKADIREKKDILMYLLKIALVIYFATGDAWQSMFFKGVYGASSELSQMVFKINAQDSENKRDGCQFGEITTSSGQTVATGDPYPSGKEYLALWDTLDCKMMRYLGYGPEASASNIASLILAGYFSFAGVGLYLSVAVMFFGFLFLALTLRALHIFLASAIGIIILVFVSPIIIPLAMFSRTADIFKKWVAELIGYCLQPMILFAYIALFINVMDSTMIGSAKFSGQPPAKAISCSKYCENSDGSIEPYIDGDFPPCMDEGDKVVDPMSDSVACLINLDDFGTMPGLEMFGLTIPVLMNIFEENVKIKLLTLLKGMMIMYLLWKFMDEIPGMATLLVGGSKLPGDETNPLAMMNKLRGVIEGIQKRAVGGGKRLKNKAQEKLREAVGSAGNMGKGDSSEGDGGGGDGGEGRGGGDAVGGEGAGDHAVENGDSDKATKE